MSRFRTVILDVDSTLCGVEGIDWLAQRRGAEVARYARSLTESAMNGGIALDAVYGERLAAIRPDRSDVGALSDVYRRTLAAGAVDAIAAMRDAGVRMVLVSGGIRQAIAPLARELGLELHAVDLAFDDDGAYAGFDGSSPLTTQRGKPDVIRLLEPAPMPPVLAVGDGATDAAMKGVVDEFAAYVGFIRRETVVAAADRVLASWEDVRGAVLGAARQGKV